MIPISLHGHYEKEKAYTAICEELARGRTVFLLVAPDTDIKELCRTVHNSGYDGKVAILEQLGYEKERISIGTTDAPPDDRSDMFSVMIGNW